MNGRSRALLLGASFLALMLGASQAAAQDTPASESVVEEIVVTGFKKSLQASRDFKRQSTSISDVIVAEDIGKSSDANIAEALRRVTGVNLQSTSGEGRKISIRGIGSDLNLVTLDGVVLSGVEGSNQGVDLSLFSADLLASVEVKKSTSADDDEGSLGGLVALRSIVPLDLRKPALSAEIQYRLQDYGDNDGFTAKGGFARQFADGRLGLAVTGNYDRWDLRNDSSSSFDWEVVDANGDGVVSAQNDFTGRRNFAINDPDINTARLIAGSGDGYATRGLEQIASLQENRRYGANATLQFKPDSQTDLFFRANYSVTERITTEGRYRWSGDAQHRQIGQADVGADGVVTRYLVNPTGPLATINQVAELNVQSVRDEFNTESLTLAFEAKRNFGRLDARLLVARADAQQERPDSFRAWFQGDKVRAGYDATRVPGDPKAIYLGQAYSLTDLSDNLLDWVRFEARKVKAVTDTIQVDFDYALNLGPVRTVEFGAKMRSDDRDSNAYTLQIDRQLPGQSGGRYFSAVAPAYQNTTVADYLTPWFFGPGFFDGRDLGAQATKFPVLSAEKLLAKRPATLPVISNAGGIWVMRTDSNAAYVKVDFSVLSDRLTGNVGVRYVDWERYTSGGASKQIAVVSGKEWLPAVNASYRLREDLVLRGAYGKVMAQPLLEDSAPNFGYNNLSLTASGSNPFLQPYRATNYDVSLEWYPSKTGYVSLAYFYKDVSDFIIRTSSIGPVVDFLNLFPSRNAQGQALDASGNVAQFNINVPANGRRGYLQGVEFGVQQDLSFLGDRISNPALAAFVGGLGGVFNYTYTDSELNYNPNAVGPKILLPFREQSKKAFNLTGYWERGGHFVRLAYNWRDDFMVTNDSVGDALWQKGGGTLDFSAQAQLRENFYLTFAGVNLTDADRYQFAREQGEGDSGSKRRALLNERYGRTLRVGLRARF